MKKNGTEQPRSSAAQKLLSILIFFAALCGVVVFLYRNTNVFLHFGSGNDFEVFAGQEEPPETFDLPLALIQTSYFEDKSALVRWESPLLMEVLGSPSEKDREALGKIVDAFNSIPGFPGIRQVGAGGNLFVCFGADKDEFLYYARQYSSEGDARESVASFSRNWNQGPVFVQAAVVIEPAGGGAYRNSVLLHEMFHMAGFAGHVEDKRFAGSILYTPKQPPGLSTLDAVAFRMVYDPLLAGGVSFEELAGFFSGREIAAYY